MPIVIGLIGEKGAGKDTFCRILKTIVGETCPVSVVKSGDIIASTLKLWGLPITRVNMQTMLKSMESTFGEGVLTDAVRTEIENDFKSAIIIYNSVRMRTDVLMVRGFPTNFLVYVTSDQLIRHSRTRDRGEKEEERNTTLEQFIEEEKAVTETDIPLFGSWADIKIDNNGDKKSLRQDIRNFYYKKLAPNRGP